VKFTKKAERTLNLLELDSASEAARYFEIREYPGWVGPHSRQQAKDALYHNGVRVRKVKSELTDTMKDGDCGTVLGSIQAPGERPAYFVEWDLAPRLAVFVVEWKLERVT
jgi:hypothetical protein